MTEIPNCLNKWGKKSPLLSSCHSLLHIHLCTQKIVLIFSFVFPQTVRETKDTGEWSWVRTAPPGEEGRGPGCAKGGLRSRGRSAWVTLCVCVCVCVCVLSHVQLFATPWTLAHQAPLSMEFSRQEYWKISFFRGSSRPGIELG